MALPSVKIAVLQARCLQPYAKNLLFTQLVMLLFIPALSALDPTFTVLIVSLTGSMTISSYLFSLDERFGADTMYSLLPVTRVHTVRGRFLFLLASTTVVTVLGVGAAYLLTAVTHKPSDTIPLAAPLAIAMVLLMTAIQNPLYYRMGYMKARIPAYGAMLAILLAVSVIVSRVPSITGAVTHLSPAIVLGGVVAVSVLAFAGSCKLSENWYAERDL